MKQMCRSIQNKTLVQTKDGVCVVLMYPAVSCMCWTVVSNKFSSGRMSVCCDGVCQTFVSDLWFSSTACSRPVWGVHRTVVSDLFGAGCASRGVVVINIHVVSGRFLWSL